MTSVAWSLYNDARSLIFVGTETAAMQCSAHVICFTNLKSKTFAKTYYKADGVAVGAGIACLAGHSRFSIFAIADATLQPTIQVIRFPDFKVLTTLASKDVTQWLDMRFSDYEYLVALSGYPDYVISMYNFRNGTLVGQRKTQVNSLAYSLLLSPELVPTVLQFSAVRGEIYFWNLCRETNEHTLYRTSKIELSEEYEKSCMHCACFAEDGTLYMVNDYGGIVSLEPITFSIQTQWTVLKTSPNMPTTQYLTCHRNNLIIFNKKRITYLVRERRGWTVKFCLNNKVQNMRRIVSNYHGDILAGNMVGDLYRLEIHPTRMTFKPLTKNNCLVKDYVILRGVKEDAAVLQIGSRLLRCLDTFRNNTYSELKVPNITAMTVHNIQPCLLVGTSSSLIYLISFAKVQKPSILKCLELKSKAIRNIRFHDSIALAENTKNRLLILKIDIAQKDIQYIANIDGIEAHILKYEIVDESRFLLFAFRKREPGELRYADEVWLYTYIHGETKYARNEFRLPHKYLDFFLQTPARDVIEFYGVRWQRHKIYHYKLTNNQLVLANIIATPHYSNIVGITGKQNIVTWGLDGYMMHFKSHKKSNVPFAISRYLQMNFALEATKNVQECFNGKFLMVLLSNGCLQLHRMPALSDMMRENRFRPNKFKPRRTRRSVNMFLKRRRDDSPTYEPKPEEIAIRTELEQKAKDMSRMVRELIDYDISVTGRDKGIFSKFCMNTIWLSLLNEEAELLFKVERKSLIAGIADQRRIRDFIKGMVKGNSKVIACKIRALFSNAYFENFAIVKSNTYYDEVYDLYRFEEEMPMDEIEQDEENEADRLSALPPPFEEPSAAEEECEEEHDVFLHVERYKKKIDNVYEHVMHPSLQVVDPDITSSHVLYLETAKSKIFLSDPLRVEFNKKFNEIYSFKQEFMDNVASTNKVLAKIYSNMNCMLCLLNLERMNTPELIAPVWMRDEVLKSIMTVDDSELKAINRRKKKVIDTGHKQVRMLLWSVEFWIRALITMMDGVLEKLWEEEIKKEIPIPEFVFKKEHHDYTLEDQKALREYDEKVRQLLLDRRKYLRILNVNEKKTKELKRLYIIKLNEKISQMALLKIKYDFAYKQEILRVLVAKYNYQRGMILSEKIKAEIVNEEKLHNYVRKYERLAKYWTSSLSELKLKVEALAQRDKAYERQLKVQILNFIPGHMVPEMSKLFKSRPKSNLKSFAVPFASHEVAARVLNKSTHADFPLPNDCLDYLKHLDNLDKDTHLPNQVDKRYWEPFTKMRRLKIENELKTKGTVNQMSHTNHITNKILKEYELMKKAHTKAKRDTRLAILEYYSCKQNQKLEVTLSMGQVEIDTDGDMQGSLKHSILMSMKDVEHVNNLIKAAGAKKLESMHKVAKFRRKVIFREWEHKVVRTNITYLNYVLQVIEKCKVSVEFLAILRNWDKRKKVRQKEYEGDDVLERIKAQRIAAFRVHLDKVNQNIDKVRGQLDQVRLQNHQIDRQIEDLRIKVSITQTKRDVLNEERQARETKMRMAKIKTHSKLLSEVRADYVRIMELSTLLELQRLRTYPTLGPPPQECWDVEVLEPELL